MRGHHLRLPLPQFLALWWFMPVIVAMAASGAVMLSAGPVWGKSQARSVGMCAPIGMRAGMHAGMRAGMRMGICVSVGMHPCARSRVHVHSRARARM